MNVESFDFMKVVDDLKEEFKKEVESQENVLEIRNETDKLIIQISTVIEKFVCESEVLKGKGVLSAMVSHRALFFLANHVSYDWALTATASRFVKLKLINGDQQ